ncbi:unnamed protein product [Darwinula stevensoni]|uniref:Mitochondrial potassium channel ATP-binding subunit n=1 Tax=Darwinula stevensoni TaxID=69355 RepID=A0A7R9AAF8_9CRUS|nr:unnamed protein product [Darwinula stevensoni]CAG0898383.1 unnamed protein product [Darwinula stevensoni]
MKNSFFLDFKINDLLFEGFTTRTVAGLLATCLGMLCVAFLYEGMKIYQNYLGYQQLKHGEVSLFSRSSATIEEETALLPRRRVISIFHMAKVGLGYCLMLVAMTFNGYLFISVCLGATLGFFLFGNYSLQDIVPHAARKQNRRFHVAAGSDEMDEPEQVQPMVQNSGDSMAAHKYVAEVPASQWGSGRLFRFFRDTMKELHGNTGTPLAPNSRNVCLSLRTKVSMWMLGTGVVMLHQGGRYHIALCRDSTGENHHRSRIVEANSIHPLADESSDSCNFWQEFWKILRPHTFLLLVAVTAALVTAGLNIFIPKLLGEVVNVLAVLARGEHTHDYFSMIRTPATKLMVCYLLQGLFTFVYVTSLFSVGERVAFALRTRLFNSLIIQEMAFFDAHRTGDLVGRLTQDIQELKSSTKLIVSQGLRSSAQASPTSPIRPRFPVGSPNDRLHPSDRRLHGVPLLDLPPPHGRLGPRPAQSHPRRDRDRCRAQAALQRYQRSDESLLVFQLSRATTVAEEALSNVRVVRTFATENAEMSLYEREAGATAALGERLGFGIGVFQGLTNVALNSIVLGTLFAGGALIQEHRLTAGDLMSFLVATQMMQRSFTQISLLFGQFVRGVTAGARVFEFLDRVPQVPVEGGLIIPNEELKGEVTYDDVRFAYPTRENQRVLKGFSFVLPEGKVVALCGPSGGGKTTIAALLERLYEVQSGRILLDGYDIRDLDPSWLRGRVIGYIPQEPVLFATSVLENIRYGRITASDEEVHEAARLANADEFIRSFPRGYDTVVGERGVTVSGGQKQRIAIARALLKNPVVIILDEATSALDVESEAAVQAALEKVMRGRTVLVIAHRLSTIKGADCIAVIADGQVVELGSHAELTERRGFYYDLIKYQMDLDRLGMGRKEG